MEEILKQILEKVSSIDEKVNRIETKLDAVYNQTVDLIEFQTKTVQNFSDIKDTLKFVMHKEIETEKEIYILKQISKT